MLQNANLNNWVCTTPDEYVEKAISFSKQIDELALLRQTLREQVTKSPLMNSSSFAIDFKNALFDIWQQHHSAKQ